MQETRVRSPRWEDLLEEEWQPLQYSCLENPMSRGAWWATVHGLAKSQTRLNHWAHCTLSWQFPSKVRRERVEGETKLFVSSEDTMQTIYCQVYRVKKWLLEPRKAKGKTYQTFLKFIYKSLFCEITFASINKWSSLDFPSHPLFPRLLGSNWRYNKLRYAHY